MIALTDVGGSVVERSIYTPYGQLTVHPGSRDQGGSVNAQADRDGDQDVATTNKDSVWALSRAEWYKY